MDDATPAIAPDRGGTIDPHDSRTGLSGSQLDVRSADAAGPARVADAAPTAVPSRQSLVVPPRGARPLVTILGASACAVVGFGMVWWTGLGRLRETNPQDSQALLDTKHAAAEVADDLSEDRALDPRESGYATVDVVSGSSFPRQPFGTRSERTSAGSADSQEFSGGAAAGKWPVRSDPEEPPVATASAFSSRPAETAREITDVEDARTVSRTAFESVDAVSDTQAADTPPLATGTPESDDVPPRSVDETTAADAPPRPLAPVEARAVTKDEPPSGGTGLSAFSGARAAPTTVVGTPPPATGPTAKAPPPDSAFDDPEAPVPVAQVPQAVRPEAVPPTPPSDIPMQTRGPERLATTDGIRGFGMAPAMGPPAAIGPRADGDLSPEDANTSDDAGAERIPAVGPQSEIGAARPGPLQLEGVQTPQVALEKRGPREVQVGKVARFETILRNVGAAIARDVTLRDAVPAGTRLVSTVPPASPDDRGGLVWHLGDLPQGGEARVAMELMPVEEGEVGSVASVAFRADASVRSLATRPDLRIEVQPPKPVLVGSAVEMSIVLSNPGTGEATGIVLEGILPEALAHSAGREVEFDVGRLRPGESRRIDLRLSSRLPGTHPLRLVARADAGVEVEEPLRITITAPTLELTADMPGRRYLQRPATCILSMANGGTAPARSVELAAQLPQGMKFVRANNAGTYDESTHRVIWHLEELPPGEVGSVELVLMPVALGPQRVAVAARALDGLSDQLVESIDVEGLAALAFQVSDSEDPVEVGGLTEYVVRVGNQGTKPASGVRVTVSLLGDLEPVEASGPVRYRVENLSIVFDPLASLAPAEESVFRVRARGRRAGDQRVQVQVTSTETGTPITKEEVTRVYADD